MADVDIGVHPAPTGAAARLAAQHAAQKPLKLYGAWFCPFVQRSWITLEEKKIPYQYVEVNPYNKDPGLLKLNPRGLVPVLAMPADPPSPQRGSHPAPSSSKGEGKPRGDTNGQGEDQGQGKPQSGGKPHEGDEDEDEDEDQSQQSLMESTVICEYLDDAYSDEALHGPRLLPLDPYRRARAHFWIDHIVTRIVPAFYKLLQHTREKAYTLDEARGELLAHLRTLAGAMDARGPWFLGQDMSLVDISLAPWAERLFLLDHYKEGGFEIPQDEEQQPADGSGGGGGGSSISRGGAGGGMPGGAGVEGPWARWRRWAQAVAERQSVRDTASEEEQYVRVYQRYADDTTNSQVGQATRQGKRLP